MPDKLVQIAIDGPVAAGKSTVAKKLADKLNLLYIDTGAMYRALALAALERGVSWQDEQGLFRLAQKIEITLAQPVGDKRDGRVISVNLEGKDVSWAIRTTEIAEGASEVSQYKEVRKVLVAKQQQMAKGKRVIMEGRDICSRVLPGAKIKIYMTADLDKRVFWNYAQLKAQGEKITLAQVKEKIMIRDQREMTRKVDPLRPVKGAWILDTTQLTINEVVDLIKKRAEALDDGK